MNLTDRLVVWDIFLKVCLMGFDSPRTERRASSQTERVEVDPANVARDFLKAHASE
jgi:hypothetical protein